MKAIIFAKRNLKEMARDPLLYIFCAGFPAVMLILFQVINRYTNNHTPLFDFSSLIPGMMMFSYSFLMLMTALHISKDKSTSFLKRLYSSPMKSYDFIIGYIIPSFIIGILQNISIFLVGYIISLIINVSYISFVNIILLVLEMLPILIISIMIGVFFGSIFNDKGAPGITSILISASGILGGAWMPVDTMGSFEKGLYYLPYYPSVYLGRIITNAIHTPTSEEDLLNPKYYTFDNSCYIMIIVIALYLLLSILLALFAFKKKMSSDNI